MKKLVLACCVIAAAATAHAGGKQESGATHNPPRVADESKLSVQVRHQGTKEGYGIKAEGNIINMMGGDRLRLDAVHGGKVVASAKCRTNYRESVDITEFDCQSDEKLLKIKGKLDLDLIYEDDKTDKEYVARRFTVNVQLWQGVTWQITPDDVLGVAWADMAAHGKQTFDRKLQLRTWIAASNVQAAAASTVLRCAVGGKPTPDIEVGMETAQELSVDIITKADKRTTWYWYLYQIEPPELWVGPRDDDQLKKDTKKKFRVTGDHPGKWSCQLRQGGRALRVFAFEVDDKGFIKPHAMQSAKGAVPLPKGVVQIDVTIPKDAAIDQRIKPADIKKSRAFGLPWPDDPSVKAIHAALPPAVENQSPKYVKPKGKRLAGIEHDPPRFIDEASTEVQVMRNGDGYRFRVFATISGHTAAGDRLRVDWRQGKKVLATGKCSWGEGFVTNVTCESQEPQKAKGALEADLIYEDDDDGNEYLLRTYKVTVYNPKAFGDPVWIAPPDDALATAWMRPGGSEDGQLELFFWLAVEREGDLKLRCTANGKQQPDYRVSPGQTPGGFVHEADIRPKQNAPVSEYCWQHIYASTLLLTGTRDKSETLRNKDSKDATQFLGDNPGAWDCMLRADGKPVRQFLFTVNKDGHVEPDPAQVDPKHPFLGKTVPVDLRFVKDSKLDTRVRGDAMKKSRGFGLPWPKPPTKPFPANSGLPDPK